jgi:hypothetical protein
MKLEKCKFRVVYQCILLATYLRIGQGMEVAIKKFMWDIED